MRFFGPLKPLGERQCFLKKTFRAALLAAFVVSPFETTASQVSQASHADPYQRGIQLRDEKKFEKAKECFQSLAEKGDVRALHNLAMCYLHLGEKETAYWWLSAASEQGFQPSLNNLRNLRKQLIEEHFWTQKESLRKWLPSFLHSRIEEIQDALEVMPTAIPCKEGEMWGKNYTFLDITQSICLACIKLGYSKSEFHERIPVVDLGCGSGFMSWKMIAAGGNVDAVAQNELAADEAKKYVLSKNFLKSGEDVENCYTVFNESILNPQALWAQRKHRIGYCGNLLHFLSPDKCARFASLMYENLLNGGILIVTVRAPYYSGSCLDYYEQNLAEGKSCPGYGVYNEILTDADTLIVTDPALPSAEIKPGMVYEGFFSFNQGISQKDQKHMHYIRNFFKAPELSALFEKAGFKTMHGHGFYFHAKNPKELIEGEPEELGSYSVSVVLEKP